MKSDYVIKLVDENGRTAVQTVRHKHMDVAVKRAEKQLSKETGATWHHEHVLTL